MNQRICLAVTVLAIAALPVTSSVAGVAKEAKTGRDEGRAAVVLNISPVARVRTSNPDFLALADLDGNPSVVTDNEREMMIVLRQVLGISSANASDALK